MDLACSTGYSSAILSKLSQKVYAVENKTKLIEQAFLNVKKLNINNIYFLNRNPVSRLKKKI